MTFSLHLSVSRLAARPAISASAAISVIALFGLALRVVFSTGPLVNDEVWSLANLRGISAFWRVLWGISHDNNHFLNSLWLYFVWPWSHDPIWLRLPSILAGAFAIPLMAQLGGRHGPAGALAASLLTALSFFQITFSVEARGYSTAALGLILAYGAIERALDDPASGARWRLAAGAGLAFFSHLAAGVALAFFALIALGEAIRRGRGMIGSFRSTFRMFWPAALAMIPTLMFVVAGYREMGGFTIGFYNAFGAGHLFSAIVNLEMDTLGLNPGRLPEIAFAVIVLPLAIVAAIVRLAPPERRIAYVAMLLGLPVAVLACRLPNTNAARYFFALSPFLLLLFADSSAAGWRQGGAARAIAVLALAAFTFGSGAALARRYAGEREPWTHALERISRSGDLAIASSFDFNVGRTVAFYNGTQTAPLELVPRARLCERRPGWYVSELPTNDPAAAAVSLAGEGCEIRYALVGSYSRYTPGQPHWGLYRRADLVE